MWDGFLPSGATITPNIAQEISRRDPMDEGNDTSIWIDKGEFIPVFSLINLELLFPNSFLVGSPP